MPYMRPNADYVPLGNLPNQTQMQVSARLSAPVIAKLFDSNFNYAIDALNKLENDVQGVVLGGIPGADDPLNTSKFLTTDGNNTNWSFVLSQNIQDAAIITSKIAPAAVVTDSLDDGVVTTPKIEGSAVTTPKIADGAITPPKIPANSIPFTKFVVPQNAAVIGGTTTNGGSWYEVAVGNYQIATKKPQNNGVTAVSLAEIWSGTNGTFDGAKITPESIDGSIAMQSNSTPLGTMKSAGTTTSVVCGRTTDQKFVEVTLGNLQVITKTTNATSPSAQNLSTVFNNEAGTPYDGSQLTDGSIPPSKLAPDPTRVFAWARVLGDGTVDNGHNVQNVTVNSAGKYTVRFTRVAPNTKYSVSMNAFNDDGGAYINVANLYEGTQTTGQFDCWTKKSGVFTSTGFYIQVFST